MEYPRLLVKIPLRDSSGNHTSTVPESTTSPSPVRRGNKNVSFLGGEGVGKSYDEEFLLPSSTLLRPLPKKKFSYYSPSHPRFEETAVPEEDEDQVELHVRRTRVQRLDMKKEVSVERRLAQNEQYKTEVQTKLRIQLRKQEQERQKKFRSNYTSYSTSFARSSNTSSMSYNRNKPRNTVRVIRQLREKRRVENKQLAQSMRRDINSSLRDSKARLKETKLKLADEQRKDIEEAEDYVLESRSKNQEEITNTVQGQKMVQGVLSSLVRSDMMFAKRFQSRNNMLYSQVRQQRQKLHRKNTVKSNKERVKNEVIRTKHAHEKAKALITSKMQKIKKDTELEQELLNASISAKKEVQRKELLAVIARMKHDFDLHQALNPEAFLTKEVQHSTKSKEKAIPWAGATSRRMDIFLDQTDKKLLPLTQVVSASEAMEDDYE